MNPATKMYGIAKSAIARLDEMERADSAADDTATGFAKELDEAAEELFADDTADLWKAYTLMSRAAECTTAGLAMTESLLSEDAEVKAVQSILEDANEMIGRSERLAGLADLKPDPVSPL